MKAFNIQWNLDDSEAELPDEIEIPFHISEDQIGDYISDQTGFCHYGFETDYESWNDEIADIINTNARKKEYFGFSEAKSGLEVGMGNILTDVLNADKHYIDYDSSEQHICIDMDYEDFVIELLEEDEAGEVSLQFRSTDGERTYTFNFYN